MLFLEKMQQKDILITCIIMISGLVVLSINSKIFFGKCLKTRCEAANCQRRKLHDRIGSIPFLTAQLI